MVKQTWNLRLFDALSWDGEGGVKRLGQPQLALVVWGCSGFGFPKTILCEVASSVYVLLTIVMSAIGRFLSVAIPSGWMKMMQQTKTEGPVKSSERSK